MALSAFNSFFAGAKENRFPKLKDRDDLWKILVTITARKATAHQRKEHAQKRGGGNVGGESAFQAFGRDDGGIHECMGKGPSGDFVTEMEEQCEHLLNLLDGKAFLRPIAEAKFQGFTNVEIAEQIGRNVRTVEHKLDLIRDIWKNHTL